ncbi:unnamed protein product [Cuscuta europaea]|uniref:Uncharacterized protein n=1 Tax=Cuscuta europaea TaxID=41803 RepID=A0A9P1E5Y3_CUSEU|nr:unnamed protein product [Cuscuta europaea]
MFSNKVINNVLFKGIFGWEICGCYINDFPECAYFLGAGPKGTARASPSGRGPDRDAKPRSRVCLLRSWPQGTARASPSGRGPGHDAKASFESVPTSQERDPRNRPSIPVRERTRPGRKASFESVPTCQELDPKEPPERPRPGEDPAGTQSLVRQCAYFSGAGPKEPPEHPRPGEDPADTTTFLDLM